MICRQIDNNTHSRVRNRTPCQNVAMDDTEERWPTVLSRHLGALIATARKASGMSAVKLSDATARLGMSVHRVAIPRIERGEQVVTVPELIALGNALDADWAAWLIEAAEVANIASDRAERIKLASTLADVQTSIAVLTERMKFTRATLSDSGLSEAIRGLQETELSAYEEALESLHAQHDELTSKLGRAPRDVSDA